MPRDQDSKSGSPKSVGRQVLEGAMQGQGMERPRETVIARAEHNGYDKPGK
ncbi:MAG: hypothetical protein GYA24_05310 [Candidatus Lokiarchaeota archaeon]|nr:hypothetical protein [Candidatus Lokiarchaeota archaeon]